MDNNEPILTNYPGRVWAKIPQKYGLQAGKPTIPFIKFQVKTLVSME